MTEEEWIECDVPQRKVDFLKAKVSERKLRLYSCGCVGHVVGCIFTPSNRSAFEISEAYADSEISNDERREAAEQAYEPISDQPMDWQNRQSSDRQIVDHAIARLLNEDGKTTTWAVEIVERFALNKGRVIEQILSISKCIFGNPFRPIINPDWLTPTAVAIATAIYSDRAFDRMPILADALEEAGCVNAEVLLHCRGAGPHVRGCWVVDLLLGKE